MANETPTSISAPSPSSTSTKAKPRTFDHTQLPGYDVEYVPPEDIAAFESALAAPDPINSSADDGSTLRSPALRSGSNLTLPDPNTTTLLPPTSVAAQHRHGSQGSLLISAQNDWAPVNERVSRPGKKRRRKALGRSVDEAREGYLYGLLRIPFLLFTLAWIIGLCLAYMTTRLYVWGYEYFVAWRGKRENLRRNLRATSSYKDWVQAAKELDSYLGNTAWKEENEYAYYDSKTVRRVWEQIAKLRRAAEIQELNGDGAAATSNGDTKASPNGKKPIDELRVMIEACVKSNFVGVENPRLYSETYYGTKNLVQNFVDEGKSSRHTIPHHLMFDTNTLPLSRKEHSLVSEYDADSPEQKRTLFKHLHANYGRTALCLSGGATFAYYHFGVVKALLEADLIPEVITGTSGGALVAALVATRTNEELKQLLIPALAYKIKACSEPLSTWLPRWWRTGARFDSVDWARQCSWWAHGSMTFREAYERTGRILNVSCVPADPHSPTILCNYLTSPDCVIWSAVLASAAVPGILNPVVLMMKNQDGSLSPYSFGHKWKDGSLRTDIPIKALNLHFNVNFTIYIKLDLTKWLKVLKHLELLPRPLGQDWSQLWLQQFGGTITIWPKSKPSDMFRILSDPDEDRLARMIHEGQQSAFPKLKFVSNRLKVEREIESGRRATRLRKVGSLDSIISQDDLQSLLRGSNTTEDESTDDMDDGDVEDGEYQNEKED
ncbi:hypothetical protein PG997_004329 [Apiospora hydei]|uniref:Patatin-like phospholipase domain-containing protein n=1 Tax=Apiospora hydei TaxID=1337664 RepID=A0ABR1X1R3_9PEZI